MSVTPLRLLHRRLAAGMGLASVVAFIAGAGLESPMPLLAAAVLLVAMVWAPPAESQRKLDFVWRILALVLAARAIYNIFVSPDDIMLPMVDLLLFLLASETWRESGAAGDTRVYTLSFALLIASSAYRPGIVFALAFVGYTGLAVVTLMVGHLIRKLSEHRVRDVKLERGFLLRIAGLSGVMLALSALVFAAFPRVSRGWMTRTTTQTTSVMGFSDRVSIGEHGSRISPNAEIVLRVEFPDGAPDDVRSLYWRGRSYDHFDGVAWTRSPALPRSLATTTFYSARWPGPRIRQRIFAAPLDVAVLFGLPPVIFVQPNSRIRALSDNAGDLMYYGGGAPSYTTVSAARMPTPMELREHYEENVRGEDFYLQLPNLDRRIPVLADSLTRGQPTRYDSVLVVQQWLRRQFTYTLDLPSTAHEASLHHFLFVRRRGHCEYFSTALTVLLRSVGIPARNVNGFLGGTWNEFGQFLTVSQNEAHSWVEVWFPRYGWVTFDATPSATTDVAEQLQTWTSPFFSFFDGFEHRWNKWILDYTVETQVSLFQRAAAPFTRQNNDGARPESGGQLMRWFRIAVLALLAAAAVRIVMSTRRRGAPTRPEARAYLRVRRAYEKAGYPLRAHDPPLAVVARLRSADAPGIEHVQQLVTLYLKARFSARVADSAERRELEVNVQAALRALRNRPADRSKKVVAA
jgi:transglutaminase-like putative cysteine protease